MKLSQPFLARTTLFITLSLLTLISILSYQKIHDLIQFDKKVIHTHEVLYKFERVMSTLKDSESSQRGFLISGDSTFLLPYVDSKHMADDILSELKTLTSDNSVQLRKIDSLIMLISKRYELMNFSIHLEETKNMPHDLMISTLQNEKLIMDDIRGVIDRCQREEETLLIVRNQEKDALIILTPIFTLVLSLFALLLILFSYFALIRELKRKEVMQKELENKVEELNRSNNELEQFAYVASHDLQEPLRKIRSFGDRLMFKQAEKLDDDCKFNIQKMQDAAGRMQKLIDDLLGFSRLVQSENKFELINLNEIVSGVINDLDEQIKAKNAQLVVPVLPPIFAVQSQMRQLFQNLLSNALKFSKQNEPSVIHIHHAIVKGIEIKEAKNILANELFHRIIIEDNGIGFDEQYGERIFVIFQRLHGKMEYGGTGIGLAVSKKIVINHSGFITARSKIGIGSSFIIYLPVSKTT